MDNKHSHHSVLVVEGYRPVSKMLDLWLHDIEKNIEVDRVATAEEARERLRHQGGKNYDLVIADEYLPGLDTGLDLYRHCLNFYPEIPFAMTSKFDANKYLEHEWFGATNVPLIINPAKPAVGRFIMGRLLDQKPIRKQIDRLKFGAIALTLAGALVVAWALMGTTAKSILQSPPFTHRFIINPAEQAEPIYYDHTPAPAQGLFIAIVGRSGR